MRAGRGPTHAATDRPALGLRRRWSRALDCRLMDGRASDAERDATVNRLREAAAEGRLTLEELTDRIEAAANAEMRSDLVPLTSDLPATAAVGIATQSVGIRGVGDVKRSGRWTVPPENSFRTWFGHIKLDLRQAQISATETWRAAHRAHRRDVLRRHQSPSPAAVGETGTPRHTHRVFPRYGFAGCRSDGSFRGKEGRGRRDPPASAYYCRYQTARISRWPARAGCRCRQHGRRRGANAYRRSPAHPAAPRL
jgi:hypothetical protein